MPALDRDFSLRDIAALMVVVVSAVFIGYASANGHEVPPALTLLTGAAAGYLFNASTDRESHLLQQRDTYRELAERATSSLESAANHKLASAGAPPFAIVLPVEPEHNSPVTETQQDTADVQTMKARIVAAMQVLC